MSQPVELTLEQQFSIRSFETQVQQMSREQAQDFSGQALRADGDAGEYVQALPEAPVGLGVRAAVLDWRRCLDSHRSSGNLDLLLSFRWGTSWGSGNAKSSSKLTIE
jgi:hypothetical protein